MVINTETLGSQENTKARLKNSLAFLLEGAVDYEAEFHRRDAVDYAALIKPGLPSELKDMYLQGLTKAIIGIDSSLTLGGNLELVFPVGLSRFSRTDAIVADYAVGQVGDMHVVHIPKSRVTARHTRELPLSTDKFSPALDIRIQTTQDMPIAVYGGPGETIQVPSPGSWHRFPLGVIEIATIP